MKYLYNYELEPVVSYGSDPPPNVPSKRFSDMSVLSVSRKREQDKTMLVLIELKQDQYEVIKSDVFAQLMHAAALAFKSGQWKDRLLCCAASLKYWHLFFISISGSPPKEYFTVDWYSRLSYSGREMELEMLYHLYGNVVHELSCWCSKTM